MDGGSEQQSRRRRKRKRAERPDDLRQFNGQLSSEQAASGIQAARMNATDLYRAAEVLYHTGFMGPAAVLGILSIEEAQKLQILLGIFLAGPGESLQIKWQQFRRHREKMSFYPAAILSRVVSEMKQDWTSELAKAVAQGTPDAQAIELKKQLLLYVDCYADGAWNLPRKAASAEETRWVLDDARVLVTHLRDCPPEELELWREHLRGKLGSPEARAAMPGLAKELTARGFVQEGAWDQILGMLGSVNSMASEEESPSMNESVTATLAKKEDE